MPFAYESTGVETHFTNYLEPEARSREVFSFHRPETLLEWVQDDSTLRDVLTSLAGRLARLDRQCSPNDRKELEELSCGVPLSGVVHSIIDAVDPDRIEEGAKSSFNTDAPTQKQLKEAALQLANSAVEVIATKPDFRKKLIDLWKSFEQTIDTVSRDRVTVAAYDQAALDAARNTVQSFEQFISEHKDEITALEILYSQPRRRPLSFADIKALAEAIEKPPRRWTPEALWRAYDALDRSKVRGASGQRLLTDIVSLVKFALHEDHALRPYTEKVNERFDNWLARQSTLGRQFTEEQIHWLELIRDHIATSLSIEAMTSSSRHSIKRAGLERRISCSALSYQKCLKS
jgi:type I restriction enzyme R subunit